MKKRKKSYVGYTRDSWKMIKESLAVYHSIIWTRKNKDKPKKVRITIEEI